MEDLRSWAGPVPYVVFTEGEGLSIGVVRRLFDPRCFLTCVRRCRASPRMEAWLYQVLPSLAAHAAIEAVAPARACVCQCHGEGVDKEVLSLLGRQLERCGPAQLAPPPAPCVGVQVLTVFWLVAAAAAAGFALGRLSPALRLPAFCLRRGDGGGAGPSRAAVAGEDGLRALPRGGGGRLARAPVVLQDGGSSVGSVHA